MSGREEVLLLCDGTVSRQLEDACQIALQEVGAPVLELRYEPLWPRPLEEYSLFAGASLGEDRRALPRVLHAALEAADAALFLHSDLDMCFLPELQAILGGGLRVLFAPYLTDSGAERMLACERAEVEYLEETVHRAENFFRDGGFARVTSAEGTDLTLSLGQWEPRFHGAIAHREKLAIVPGGQVTRVPDDGSANGRLVVDRTVAANHYQRLSTPIEFTVENGNVVAISGGTEAAVLERFLGAFDDERVYHLTELGIGTNPRCRLAGVGAPAEDTHTWGTVSFALGCDTHIGGGLPAPVHIDMTMHCASLQIDGEDVVQDGRLAYIGPPAQWP